MNISNPYVGERRPGSVGLPLPGVSVRLVRWRDPAQRPQPLRRILAARRSHPRRLRRWLVPHRRSGRVRARRLLHPLRPQERPHHLRRLQHLPARNRRIPAGAGRSRRSRRGRRVRPRPRRSPRGLHRLPPPHRPRRPRRPLPRQTRLLQSPARLPPRRLPPAQRHGQNPEAPPTPRGLSASPLRCLRSLPLTSLNVFSALVSASPRLRGEWPSSNPKPSRLR